jgi:hypothetical protein
MKGFFVALVASARGDINYDYENQLNLFGEVGLKQCFKNGMFAQTNEVAPYCLPTTRYPGTQVCAKMTPGFQTKLLLSNDDAKDGEYSCICVDMWGYGHDTTMPPGAAPAGHTIEILGVSTHSCAYSLLEQWLTPEEKSAKNFITEVSQGRPDGTASVATPPLSSALVTDQNTNPFHWYRDPHSVKGCSDPNAPVQRIGIPVDMTT